MAELIVVEKREYVVVTEALDSVPIAFLHRIALVENQTELVAPDRPNLTRGLKLVAPSCD